MLITKLKTKDDCLMQWQTKSVNITTNFKSRIYFTLPDFSTTRIMMQDCHVDDYNKGRFDMIMDRDILT